MAWQIRRQDDFDGTDEISPQTHATAALAYDVAMDDVQARVKAMLIADPTLISFKIKGIRDNIAVPPRFTLLLQNVRDRNMAYTITEV